MSGRGDPATVPPLADERVLVSRGGELESAREPLHRDPNAAVGPGMSFAARVLKAGGCDRLVLVPCAVGGTWIDRWVPGADLFFVAVDEMRAALRHGELGGILWHQGEANAANRAAAESYARYLTMTVEGFREALGGPIAPFIAGEIGRFLSGYPDCPEFGLVNQAIHQVCHRLPGCAAVSSEGLGHTGDFLHFNAKAARTLGSRYADAWLATTGP
jgi:hypothetical protein